VEIKLSNLGPISYVVFSVVATATQLRPVDSSVGAAEFGLVVSVALCVLTIIITGRISITGRIKGVLALMTAAAIALCLGFFSRQYLGLENTKGARDSVAIFAAAFGAVMISSMQLEVKVLRLMLKLYVLFTTIPLFLLLLSGLFGLTPLGLDPWYQGVRFQGWATNPNQVGLVIGPCLPIALWLAASASRVRDKVCWVGLACLIVAIGLASQSDALILGWAACGLLVTLLTIWNYKDLLAFPLVGGQLFLRTSLQVLLAAPIFFLLSLIEPKIAAVLDEGDQAGIRLTLWERAIDAWVHSPFFGLGPGPHSGYISSLEEVEAHNTLLDWISAAGSLGLIIFIVAVGLLFQRLWATRQTWLLGAVFWLLIFSLFHFVLRHPVVWLVIALCVMTSEASRKAIG
jgi:O-antigen ligase